MRRRRIYFPSYGACAKRSIRCAPLGNRQPSLSTMPRPKSTRWVAYIFELLVPLIFAYMITSMQGNSAHSYRDMCRTIWPQSKIMLCFWHVRKACQENAMQKISRIEERAAILNELGNIMYSRGMGPDDDLLSWALHKLGAKRFTNYLRTQWRNKIADWCIAFRNVPHAGQNTNAAMESYHSNLKSILFSSKQKLFG